MPLLMDDMLSRYLLSFLITMDIILMWYVNTSENNPFSEPLSYISFSCLLQCVLIVYVSPIKSWSCL